ncbi:MAG: TetR/AcrR family transcriptional regulator [Acidobacteria bacterium]|nr:TetR/AcrR family transcriptional regulator [Acidobacteriota bacterium]MBI3422084.1 TetR/AcrR family transcriptional regulator [Acidobacteriota bacterium]
MRNHKTKKLADGAPESERLAEIYHVAAQIICDKGFDAMTMNDIAAAVGMTKAGVYHYIQGKRELLFGIMDYGMTQLEQRVIAPAQTQADPEERLHSIIAAHAHMIANGEHAITIVVDEVAGLDARARKAINERKRVYFEFLRATLDELKAQGRMQDVDTTVAAFSLFGMILWLPHWFRTNGRLDTEQVVSELIKMASAGLVRAATKAVRKTART